MALDEKTLKDFAQAVIGAAGAPSTIKYGTATVDGAGNTYVTLDGSSTMTPVIGNMDIRTGDRITVDIIDHQAVVTGNTTAPPSGRYATEQPLRVFTEYAKGNSATTPPSSGWSEIMPEHEKNDYIWSRVVNQFANGSTQTDTPKLVYGGTGSDGKDSSSMEISSENGNAFKEPDDDTTISIVVRKGDTEIKSLSEAVLAYDDSSVNVRWEYKRLSTGATYTIPDNYPGLASNKFSLYVSAESTIMDYSDTKFIVTLYTSPSSGAIQPICSSELTVSYTEPSTAVTIKSSNGITFKDDVRSTTLIPTLTMNGSNASNSSSAKYMYGVDVKVQWQYKGPNDNQWTTIPESEYIDKGFQLFVSSLDVQGSKTYRATVYKAARSGYSVVVGTADVTLNDVIDGYTHGLTSYAYTFKASTPAGADIGAKCTSVVYLYSGTEKKSFSISSVTVPQQYISATIKGQNTTAPYVEYEVIDNFTSTQQALIKYAVDGLTFEQIFTMGVSAKGNDGQNGTDGQDGMMYGADPAFWVFTGDSEGVAVGTEMNLRLFYRRGSTPIIIDVDSSDISCPSGLEIKQIWNSGTTSPLIWFRVTEKFSETKQAIITIRAHGVIPGTYEIVNTAVNFAVALQGTDGEPGPPGKDGAGTYTMNITSSNGTVFTDREESTTLTASLLYGETELSIASNGTVYNDYLEVGVLQWRRTGQSSPISANSITINANVVNPAIVVTATFRSVIGPSLPNINYCERDTTIVFCSNIKESKRYYAKKNITDPEPSKPTDFPPEESFWVTTEPRVTESEIETTKIYFVDGVLYSNDTFVYSDVAEYTAFESSKYALSRALAAITVSEAAQEASDEAKQNAYDALIAATAYLKLDPVLQKIVVSKLGTSSWSTFAIDSVGSSVGMYDPVNHTFDEYSQFLRNGIKLFTKRYGTTENINSGIDIIYGEKDQPIKNYALYLHADGAAGDYYWGNNLFLGTCADKFKIDTRRTFAIHTYNDVAHNYSDTSTGVFALSGGNINKKTPEPSLQYEDQTSGFFLGSIKHLDPWHNQKDAINYWESNTPDGIYDGITSAGGYITFIDPHMEYNAERYTIRYDMFSEYPYFVIGGSKQGTYQNRPVDFYYTWSDGDSEYPSLANYSIPMFIHKGSYGIHYSTGGNESQYITGYPSSVIYNSITKKCTITFRFTINVAYPIIPGTNVQVTRITLSRIQISSSQWNEDWEYYDVQSISAKASNNGSSITLLVTAISKNTLNTVPDMRSAKPMFVDLSSFGTIDFDFS